MGLDKTGIMPNEVTVGTRVAWLLPLRRWCLDQAGFDPAWGPVPLNLLQRLREKRKADQLSVIDELNLRLLEKLIRLGTVTVVDYGRG